MKMRKKERDLVEQNSNNYIEEHNSTDEYVRNCRKERDNANEKMHG